jgi:hypothetical protein
MVKIALCLTGQPRFVSECYPYIYENLIRPNGIEDVFAHIWFNKEMCNKSYKYGGAGGWEHQRISELSLDMINYYYKPKTLEVEAPKLWKASHIDFSENAVKLGALVEPDNAMIRLPSDCISMWASIHKVNQIKQMYEWENDIRYDYVIRLRTDIILTKPILLDSLDPNTVHASDLGQPPNHVSDWINISNSRNANIASNILSEYDHLIQDFFLPKKIVWSNEQLLWRTLVEHSIPWKLHDWGTILPRF